MLPFWRIHVKWIFKRSGKPFSRYSESLKWSRDRLYVAKVTIDSVSEGQPWMRVFRHGVSETLSWISVLIKIMFDSIFILFYICLSFGLITFEVIWERVCRLLIHNTCKVVTTTCSSICYFLYQCMTIVHISEELLKAYTLSSNVSFVYSWVNPETLVAKVSFRNTWKHYSRINFCKMNSEYWISWI